MFEAPITYLLTVGKRYMIDQDSGVCESSTQYSSMQMQGIDNRCSSNIVCNHWLKYRDSTILIGSCMRVYSIECEIL